MVFIIKYLWEKIPKYTPPPFQFDPFGFDEEVSDIEPHIEGMVDFVNEFDDPLAHLGKPGNNVRTVDCELQHPRPVPKIALQDALAKFEKMACLPDTLPELVQRASLNESAPYSSLHDIKPLGEGRPVTRPQGDTRYGPLLFGQHKDAMASTISNSCFNPSVAVPEPNPASLRPSGGLACLSPSFLEHFEGYERTQPPRPTFVLSRRSTDESVPVQKPVPMTGSHTSDDSSTDSQIEEVRHDALLPVELSKEESVFNWIDKWNDDGLCTTETSRSGLSFANDSFRSAALDDYFGDDESSDSGSSYWSSPSPMALISQPPSPDLPAYDTPAMRFVPRASANIEADDFNAAFTLHRGRMVDEAMSGFLPG